MDGTKNFVVGYDGSRLSELALRRALVLASWTPFAWVHVVSVATERGDDYELPSGQVLPPAAAREFLRLHLTGQAHQWGLDVAHVRLVVHLRTGRPAGGLIETAYRYGADLLVLGQGSGERLGRVTREVLEYTHDLEVHVETAGASMRPVRGQEPNVGWLVPWRPSTLTRPTAAPGPRDLPS